MHTRHPVFKNRGGRNTNRELRSLKKQNYAVFTIINNEENTLKIAFISASKKCEQSVCFEVILWATIDIVRRLVFSLHSLYNSTKITQENWRHIENSVQMHFMQCLLVSKRSIFAQIFQPSSKASCWKSLGKIEDIWLLLQKGVNAWQCLLYQCSLERPKNKWAILG